MVLLLNKQTNWKINHFIGKVFYLCINFYLNIHRERNNGVLSIKLNELSINYIILELYKK